jgi:hypothetical protein
MSPRLFLARRRAGLHPGFVRAVESKPDLPAEIYAYPAQARREAPNPWKPSKVPAAPLAPEPAPRAVCGLLVAAYVALGVALWVVAATIPGA